MTQERKEYLRNYMRKYRAEGFGKEVDRRYYARHREDRLEDMRLRYESKVIARKRETLVRA